jgi:GAF domain-containing protein
MVQQGLAGWVIKNREAALIADTTDDPRWVKREWHAKKESSRSVIAIPLIAGEKVIGVMTLARPADKKFSEQELNVLLEYILKYMK